MLNYDRNDVLVKLRKMSFEDIEKLYIHFNKLPYMRRNVSIVEQCIDLIRLYDSGSINQKEFNEYLKTL
jgi:hypothetical protein